MPKFETFVVDARHGAIHVPVVDLNGDGHLDFVALLSQEHETVVAYLNEGNGAFRPETIFVAPQPAYGSSGIDVTDLDDDGDRFGVRSSVVHDELVVPKPRAGKINPP